MRKLRIITILFILAFSFSIKAEVLFELDCNNKDISKENSVTCGVRIIYETEGVTDISFDYETNLNVDVQSVTNFNLSKAGNHIVIHTDTPLYDELMNSEIIMNVTLLGNDNVKESEAFSINNIKINNNSKINVDNVSESFNITLPKVLDNDCSLSSISIDNKEISNFNKDILEYNLTTTTEVIFIDAVRSSEKSSVTGLGKVRIPVGETKLVEILVKAESGKEQKYKLNITNKQVVKEEVKVKVKDSDNTLKVLDLYNNATKIDYSFDSKKDSYSINVKDVNKIAIQAITNSASAGFVENYGPREVNLKVGNNVILVKVQAENGNVKTYTLNINVSETVIPKKVEVTTVSASNNDEIILADEEDSVSSTQVNEAVTTTQTETKSEDTKKEETKKEETTTNNEESVVTTGEDAVEDNNVVEEPKEEKPLFQKIMVKGYDIGFSKDKHSYSLKVEKNVDELEIEVTPENLEFEIVDNKRIHNGSKITVKVFDTEGEHEYTINIEKDSLFLNIFCYGIFGVGLAVLVYVVYGIIKKKKKCKKVLNTEEI